MQNQPEPNIDADMFDLAPVSLWLEDFSGVKQILEQWRAEGVTDLRSYLLADKRRVTSCSQRIKVLKVNRKTLSLFEAENLAHLVSSLGSIFRDDMLSTHVEELVQLWEGKQLFTSNTVNYTVDRKSVV